MNQDHPMKLKQCAVPGYSLLEIGPYNQHGEPQSSIQLPTDTIIYIVLACNSYPALVAAAEEMRDWAADITGWAKEGFAGQEPSDHPLSKLRAAIQKARGE